MCQPPDMAPESQGRSKGACTDRFRGKGIGGHMLEQKLIDQVIDGWVFDQNFPTRNRKKKPIPNRDDVKEILDQAFLASLKREEDRPISFTLTFLNKEDVDAETESIVYHQIIVTFDEELPFSVEAISKIASAFDPKISALIVGKSKEDGKFSIWGGMFFWTNPKFFSTIYLLKFMALYFLDQMFLRLLQSMLVLLLSKGQRTDRCHFFWYFC